MKLSALTFAIICVVQATTINARTVEEVQEDFEHIFLELHNSLTHLEKFLSTEGSNKLNNLKATIPKEGERVEIYIDGIQDYVKDKARQSLNAAGLLDRPDLVQRCTDTEDSVLADLTQQSIGGSQLCAAYANGKLETTNHTIIAMQYELYNMHLEVEYTRRECAPKTHPLEMQACLIENLYEKNKPAIADFETQVIALYRKIHVDVETAKSALSECSNMEMNVIGEKSNSIIQEFNSCVDKIAN